MTGSDLPSAVCTEIGRASPMTCKFVAISPLLSITKPVPSPCCDPSRPAKLMTTIGKYDDRGVPFFAWLLRLARNLAIDHIRANRLMPTENVIDPDVSSGSDLDRAETVRAALATLPEEQRQVVFLRHVVGLLRGVSLVLALPGPAGIPAG